MNCNNKFNYQVSQSTAMPNNQGTLLRSTDHMWSPFSTPLFTPYDINSATAASFQYSNSFYSMSLASLQSRNESYKSANKKSKQFSLYKLLSFSRQLLIMNNFFFLRNQIRTLNMLTVLQLLLSITCLPIHGAQSSIRLPKTKTSPISHIASYPNAVIRLT